MSVDISQFNVKQDLDKLNVGQLRKLLGERGQTQRGSKGELMTRLWPIILTERILAGPLEEVNYYQRDSLAQLAPYTKPQYLKPSSSV